jgi:UDP-N-acetyl-D-mannosaminuronic acid dehydrogenase
MEFNKICVVGLGYIGLPTAAVLASRGIKVLGIDITQSVVDTINDGCIHIVEADLDQLVQDVVKSGNLQASTTPEAADAFLIAVPTPFKENHKPDLAYVEAATKSIAPVLRKGNLVVLESTSPVGTTEKMSDWLADVRPDLSFPHQAGDAADIQVAYCPERVLPGRILHELVENDRVVGGLSPQSTADAIALYKTFVKGECLASNARTAEMSKLTENAFRDVNIAFANELSLICDQLDIDVWELISLANRHPRVNILQPGPGVGGHCIAVDPWFIVDKTPEQAKIIRTAREINNYKTDWVVEKIIAEAGKFSQKQKRSPKIVLMGLAYKPDIDDLRESPAVWVAQKMLQVSSDEDVFIVEPNIKKHKVFQLTKYEDANLKADIIVFLVRHKEFIHLEKQQKTIELDFCGVRE